MSDYLNEFPEGTVAFDTRVRRDPETGELQVEHRDLTKREIMLRELTREIAGSIGDIFADGLSTDPMLTEIELELRQLLEKVNRYGGKV